MSHVHIAINEEVIFDGDLDTWRAATPDEFKDALRPGANPQPWLKAIMIAMSDAVMTGTDVSIEAATEPGRWLVGVTQT